MADEQNELRRINWSELFPFTRIFKSFRMAACQPAKVGLALGAILVLFVAGWLLGVIWSWTGATAFPGEIDAYRSLTSAQFNAARENWEDGRLPAAAAALVAARNENLNLTRYQQKLGEQTKAKYYLAGFKKEIQDRKKPTYDAALLDLAQVLDKAGKDDKDPSDLLDDAESIRDDVIEAISEAIGETAEEAEEIIDADADLNDDQKEKQKDLLDEEEEQAWFALTQLKRDWAEAETAIQGRQIFTSFMDYELACIDNALSAVWRADFFNGIQATSGGFVGWMMAALQGFCWMISEHWIFAIFFLPLLLGVFALFGGAISRITALDFARNERISIGQGLRFSAGKFLSFFLSPVLVLILVLLGGALLALGGFIGSIPYAGEIFMSLLFFLALIMGMVLAFFLIGFVAGSPLMYPTIAVEGSDSFDGISRSIMYVYSHPWHTLFYGLVTVIYGALTYLFVRFFLFLALLLTHMFVGWGLIGGGETLGSSADKLDLLWAAPTFENLYAGMQWQALGGWSVIWAFVLNVWVFLIAALVFAYLISFFFTASTVVYYLLRRKIDSVEMDDVYVEEIEEQQWIEPETAPAEDTPENNQDPGEESAPADEQEQEGSSESSQDSDEDSDSNDTP